MQQFTIHRLDQTVASGPKFATIEEVRAHLEAIAKLPLWRLDLVNNSAIVFDPAELEITDPTQHSTAGVRAIGPGRASQTPGMMLGHPMVLNQTAAVVLNQAAGTNGGELAQSGVAPPV